MNENSVLLLKGIKSTSDGTKITGNHVGYSKWVGAWPRVEENNHRWHAAFDLYSAGSGLVLKVCPFSFSFQEIKRRL